MSDATDLNELRQKVLSDGCSPEQTNEGIRACLKVGTGEALALLAEMVDHDYGGWTFKWHQKYTSALACGVFGSDGFAALADCGLRTERHSSRSVAIQTLAHFAAGTEGTLAGIWCHKAPDLEEELSSAHNTRELARGQLTRLAAGVDAESELSWDLVSALNALAIPDNLEKPEGRSPSAELFEAMLTGWFRINDAGIQDYRALLAREPIEEEVHQFLASEPHLLNPLQLRTWSKPRLGEELVADFVVQQVDNSYRVVEIESPGDLLMTKSGNLSAAATEAVRQALEYRQWLVDNRLYAVQQFPDLQSPHAIAVVGMESSLNAKQRARLHAENDSRRGSVEIIGFDRLADRATALLQNLLMRSRSTQAIVSEIDRGADNP